MERLRLWLGLSLILATILVAGCSSSSTGGGSSNGTGSGNSAPVSQQQKTLSGPKRGDLCRAIRDGADTTAIRALLDAGADVNENVGDDQNQVTPLLVAAAYGRGEIADLLKARGARTSASYGGYGPEELHLFQDSDPDTGFKGGGEP